MQRIREAAAARVEVACIDMDTVDQPLAEYWRTLSDEERLRADGFRFEDDRRRFIIRRGALRARLSRRLRCAAESVTYSRNPYGKLSVAGSDIRFNLSSSRAIALFAVADGHEIGCDIERVKPDFAFREIAERYFAASELAQLKSAPLAEQPHRFFQYWTLKEAYVKCRGLGMSLPLEEISIIAQPGGRFVVAGEQDVSLVSFEPLRGYGAALAVRAPSFEIVPLGRSP